MVVRILISTLIAQVGANSIAEPKLIRLAESASSVEVYRCKLLPTPPISHQSLLRPRLIALGKPRRLTKQQGQELLQRFQAIPNLWTARAGEVVFEPTILVRYHAKRSVDLTIDPARGALSLDDTKSVGYSLQTVRRAKDPLVTSLLLAATKHAR